jgi:hypothetical protein
VIRIGLALVGPVSHLIDRSATWDDNPLHIAFLQVILLLVFGAKRLRVPDASFSTLSSAGNCDR